MKDMAMDQYLYIAFLGGWISINPSYFDVNKKGVQGFDTLPYGIWGSSVHFFFRWWLISYDFIGGLYCYTMLYPFNNSSTIMIVIKYYEIVVMHDDWWIGIQLMMVILYYIYSGLYDYDNPSLAGYLLTNQCKNGWDKLARFKIGGRGLK